MRGVGPTISSRTPCFSTGNDFGFELSCSVVVLSVTAIAQLADALEEVRNLLACSAAAFHAVFGCLFGGCGCGNDGMCRVGGDGDSESSEEGELGGVRRGSRILGSGGRGMKRPGVIALHQLCPMGCSAAWRSCDCSQECPGRGLGASTMILGVGGRAGRVEGDCSGGRGGG